MRESPGLLLREQDLHVDLAFRRFNADFRVWGCTLMEGLFEFKTEAFVLQPRDGLRVVIEVGLSNRGIV